MKLISFHFVLQTGGGLIPLSNYVKVSNLAHGFSIIMLKFRLLQGGPPDQGLRPWTPLGA